MVCRRKNSADLARQKEETPLKRGEIWVANMNPARGHEVGKIRPVLIVQADWLTEQGSVNIVAVPLSSQVNADTAYFRPILAARDNLRTASQILVDQPRTIDRRRFGPAPLTRLSAPEMTRVEECLRVALGLAPIPS